MNEITLTINGREVKGKQGDTVLEVCQANGIDVPTLCHLEGLSDVGACRMCVVEIEKERRPVPSCTYPIRDGLVVKTNTERLEKYRRQILELIFTEHNHFCMFCEASGDCELQKLAYRYQMDNVRYPYTFPSLSVDSLSDYLVIDHNRCILCGRCIRACSEVAAGYTLNFSQRGWKETVSADLEQPLGESSCLSCGACVQACPTGAIFGKLSLYKGREDECQRIQTVCPGCGVGCKIEVLVKDNNLVKIEAPDLTGDPRGALCRLGRFGLLQATPPRVTSPLIRDSEGELRECSLDEAIAVIVRRLDETNGEVAGMVATRLPNETLSLFKKFTGDVLGSDALDTLDGETFRVIRDGISQLSVDGRGLNIECPIEEIEGADCIMVVGADPQETNPIVSTLVRRAVSQRKAKLIVVNSSRDVFPLWTDLWLKPKAGSEGALLRGLRKLVIEKGLTKAKKPDRELSGLKMDEVVTVSGIDRETLEAAAEVYAKAECGVIIYGEGLLRSNDTSSVATALKLAEVTGNRNGDSLRVISLKSGANSRGAWELGLAKGIKDHKPKMLYLFLGDEPESEELLRRLRGVDFLVAQTSYYSPVVYMADVVLPSPIWAERMGTYVSLDGHVQEFKQVLKPKDGTPQDSDILMEISKKLGQTLP
jgi:predicted molibdopterin-dependent oxidoreductase YjgC